MQACKFAIREVIEIDTKQKNTSFVTVIQCIKLFLLINNMQENKCLYAPREVTQKHFEEAMKYARKSVSDDEIMKHVIFAQKYKKAINLTKGM